MDGKIIAIQQPEHLPWLGFFDKMAKCDEYVYLDSVQFKKRYFENRNRVHTSKGAQWITVPVFSKGHYHQKINEIMIDNGQNWRRKYLGTIKHAYSKTKFFEEYFVELEKLVYQEFVRLIDLNISLINWIREKLEISTSTVMVSFIREYKEKGSDLILTICKNAGAKRYISGPDGRNYLHLEAFAKEGIEVIYHDYKHPEYQQMYEPFISHLSVIDAMFCEGSLKVKKLIKDDEQTNDQRN